MNNSKRQPVFSFRVTLMERLPFCDNICEQIIDKLYDEKFLGTERYRLYNLMRMIPKDHEKREEVEKYNDFLNR